MVKPKNKHSLSHVRHDPAHCLAPGLFRALKRGERKRSKLDVTYDYGDGKRIEFSGPEPLGADDLRILQGLVAMAGPNGLVLGPEPKTEGGRQLRLFLEPKWEAVTADAMVVKGSYRALAKEIGAEVDSGGALKHIQDCIERLWKVSIIAQNGRKRQGFRLLSEYASDEADGRLYVALTPLIAQAVMGGGQHVRISMDEVRALDSETARLLHQRLCGWIDPGKTGKASIDTLCGYVWPSEASGSTMRKRRQRVREALPELVALGWTVTEFAAGKYDITRPKAAGKTCSRLGDEIAATLRNRDYISDASVNVQITNFKFSVLGEVASPGTYNVDGQRLTILEALSRAGDLNIDGNRDITLIRETNGRRQIATVDLRSKDLFQSPYYYIQQNDTIYVTPAERKINTRSDTVQYIGWTASGLGLIIGIVALCAL